MDRDLELTLDQSEDYLPPIKTLTIPNSEHLSIDINYHHCKDDMEAYDVVKRCAMANGVKGEIVFDEVEREGRSTKWCYVHDFNYYHSIKIVAFFEKFLEVKQ